jgi:hypothetical protein
VISSFYGKHNLTLFSFSDQSGGQNRASNGAFNCCSKSSG